MTTQITGADRTGVGRSRPLGQRELRIVFGGLVPGMLPAAAHVGRAREEAGP